jgi:hypothetical protein
VATYNQSKDAWPYADEQGEYGKKLNNLTKFVASSRLHDAPSGDFPAATVTRDPAATVRELKEQSTEAALAAIRADHAATHNAQRTDECTGEGRRDRDRPRRDSHHPDGRAGTPGPRHP